MLLRFLARRKLWFLIPLISVVLLFALLLILTKSSAVAPFVYPLF